MDAKEEKGTEQQKSELIEKLKADMSAEFEKYKSTIKKEMDERDAQIKKLSEENESLRASVARHTLTDPPKEQPKERTSEELYQEEVNRLAEKAMKAVKYELTGDQ